MRRRQLLCLPLWLILLNLQLRLKLFNRYDSNCSINPLLWPQLSIRYTHSYHLRCFDRTAQSAELTRTTAAPSSVISTTTYPSDTLTALVWSHSFDPPLRLQPFGPLYMFPPLLFFSPFTFIISFTFIFLLFLYWSNLSFLTLISHIFPSIVSHLLSFHFCIPFF